MSRRTNVVMFFCLIVAPTLTWAQAPSPYLPPTRVPETPEPELSPKNRSSDQPRTVAPNDLPPGTSSAVSPLPVTSSDPPTPMISIHVSAPAGASAGSDVEYKILVENRSQAAAHHVRVTATKPDGVQLLPIDPAAQAMTSFPVINAFFSP